MAQEKPHHAGQKTVAPVCPGRTGVLPFAAIGVHGIEIGVIFYQPFYLLFGVENGVLKQLAVGLVAKLNQATPCDAIIGKWQQRSPSSITVRSALKVNLRFRIPREIHTGWAGAQ